MSRSDDLLLYRVAMAMLPGMDVPAAEALLAACGSEQAVFEATETELKGIKGIHKGVKSTQTRHTVLEKARREVDFITQRNVTVRWFKDTDVDAAERYPARLLRLDKAPVMIFSTGTCDLDKVHTVGIVGTRHATAYGTTFTERLVADLAERLEEPVIVSGLAYGIDIAAHRAALAADIPTVGVVAHGLSTIYPAVHRDTASRMVKRGGMVMTEYSSEAAVSRYNFLARNRLVAALSDALVVVESGEQGGALSTARHAAVAGVPVFALPGRVTDAYSRGCNALIASGIARPIDTADDIINQLGWLARRPKDDASVPSIEDTLTPEEKLTLRCMMLAPECDNDMLTASTGLAPSRLMTILIGLEMRGIIASLPGNRSRIVQTIDHTQLLN